MDATHLFWAARFVASVAVIVTGLAVLGLAGWIEGGCNGQC